MPRNEFAGCGRAYHGFGYGADVKGALLGKTPRYSPDRTFDTLHVAITLDIDLKKQSARGSCATRVRVFKPSLREFVFDADGLRVSSAKVDGKTVRHRMAGGKLKLTLRTALPAGHISEVEVRYTVINPKAGLHFVTAPPQVWSQSQPEDARYWFPCHDAPHQKATSETIITVPKGFRVVSNGVLLETSSAYQRSIFHHRMTRPHAIYLISIAVGRFAEIREEWDGIPINYYCEHGREEDARRGFAKTPKALAFFSEITGMRYPYEKYAQVAAANFPGGMENTTCTTQTDAILIDRRAALDNDLDMLVAHELAHQWFGDLVTCRDWSHAWLNEGFATYFEVLFQEHDKGRDEAEHELFQNAQVYFEEDAQRYRRPIVCAAYKEPQVLFDRHLYEKGAWVLHMLRAELKDPAWRASIRRYLEKHQDGSVETGDLAAAIEAETGRNIKPFFDQWIYKAGYPHFRVHYAWENGRAKIWILQTQEGEGVPVFKVPLKLRFEGAGWTREFDEAVTEKEHRFSYKLPGEPLDFQFDPEHAVLKKLSLRKPHKMWARQLIQGRTAWTRHEAASHISRWGSDESAALLERAVRKEKFWGAAAEMARGLGEIASDAAFRALARLIHHKHPKVRRAVIEALGRQKRPQSSALIAPFARKDPSLSVEAQACRSLGTLRDPRSSAVLRQSLSKKSYRDMVGSAALSGLASLRGAGTLTDLRRAAQSPATFYRRAQAVRSLVQYAAVSLEVVPWLCAIAVDKDERIGMIAVASLGQLEDERAIPVLKKLRKSPSTHLRVHAEEALARIQVGKSEQRKD